MVGERGAVGHDAILLRKLDGSDEVVWSSHLIQAILVLYIVRKMTITRSSAHQHTDGPRGAELADEVASGLADWRRLLLRRGLRRLAAWGRLATERNIEAARDLRMRTKGTIETIASFSIDRHAPRPACQLVGSGLDAAS